MRPLLAATAALALATGFSSPADATLQIAADINGTSFVCADQAACDTNPVVGQLQIANQTINGVEFEGSSQSLVNGPSNNLNSSSFQVVNTNLTPASIQLAVSGTNFLGPVAVFSASGSGTWQNASGSSTALTYFGDPANTQGATTPTDLPGSQLADITSTAVGATDSFSQDVNGPFSAAGLYSMSLGTTGTLAAWNGLAGDQPTLVGRSQTIVTAIAVDEPGSLALLGIGLVALGGFGRWRSKQERRAWLRELPQT